MDYSELNGLLNNLKLENNQTELVTNNVSYNNSEKFKSVSNKREIKSRETIENLSVNRNQELVYYQNGAFNFEEINPQRETFNRKYNDESIRKNKSDKIIMN